MQQSGATAFAIQAADAVDEELPQMMMTHQDLSDPQAAAASIVVTAPTSDLVHIQATTGGFSHLPKKT